MGEAMRAEPDKSVKLLMPAFELPEHIKKRLTHLLTCMLLTVCCLIHHCKQDMWMHYPDYICVQACNFNAHNRLYTTSRNTPHPFLQVYQA